jgi:hypothetical protein
MGTALALPWLEAMAGPAPLIAGLSAPLKKPPVRMAFLYVPNGMHMPDWKPQGDERNFEMPKILKPVAEFRDHMTVFSGLSLRGAKALGDGGGDHARSVAAFLTGAHPKKTHGDNIRNGKSVDQVAADKIGHLTRLPSIELGTEASAPAGKCDTGYSCLYTSNISWRTETSPMAKEIDPAAVFERLFGSTRDLENKKALDLRQRRRQSILDFVNQDAKTLHQQLGVEDRQKLSEYLYAVREIERRLQTTDKLEQPETDVPDFPRPEGVPAEYAEHVKLLFDMLVLAFQTDSTRVVSLMYTNAGSNRSYRNLEINQGHHDLSHHGNSFPKQKKISEINRYHVSLLHHLLTGLSQVREGDGTLLDNCMVMYGSGIADGNSHDHDNLPIALFGKGGGTIRGGQHIRVRPGTPLTNLYVSMLDRVGASVDKFSDSNGRVEDLA